MRIIGAVLILAGLAACASTRGEEPTVVPKAKNTVVKAGILPSKSIPAERDGIRVEDTGAIMFICANSDKHEDREVLIGKCPECSELNYFYWDRTSDGFRCYACTKPFPNEFVKCELCGKPPRKVRTKNKPKSL
jgi:hypothetical protein